MKLKIKHKKIRTLFNFLGILGSFFVVALTAKENSFMLKTSFI